MAAVIDKLIDGIFLALAWLCCLAAIVLVIPIFAAGIATDLGAL